MWGRTLTLDDLEIREHARFAAGDLLGRAPRLTLDDVQREPELLLAVKRAVDEDRPRRNGRFLLTGSANLLLMHRVSETLAGRATYVNLWPLTRRERLGLGAPGIWSELLSAPVPEWIDLIESRPSIPADWRDEARRGGYPTPAVELQRDDTRSFWFDGYLWTYLERDLQTMAAIDNLVDFRRLMRAACLRLGTMVNQTELGRDSRVPAPEVLYWRTTTDLEVDFLIETGGRLLPIEVKATASPGYSDTRSLRAFREEYPDRFIGGLLLHGGAETQWMSDRVLAVPWWRVLYPSRAPDPRRTESSHPGSTYVVGNPKPCPKCSLRGCTPLRRNYFRQLRQLSGVHVSSPSPFGLDQLPCSSMSTLGGHADFHLRPRLSLPDTPSACSSRTPSAMRCVSSTSMPCPPRSS